MSERYTLAKDNRKSKRRLCVCGLLVRKRERERDADGEIETDRDRLRQCFKGREKHKAASGSCKAKRAKILIANGQKTVNSPQFFLIDLLIPCFMLILGLRVTAFALLPVSLDSLCGGALHCLHSHRTCRPWQGRS